MKWLLWSPALIPSFFYSSGTPHFLEDSSLGTYACAMISSNVSCNVISDWSDLTSICQDLEYNHNEHILWLPQWIFLIVILELEIKVCMSVWKPIFASPSTNLFSQLWTEQSCTMKVKAFKSQLLVLKKKHVFHTKEHWNITVQIELRGLVSVIITETNRRPNKPKITKTTSYLSHETTWSVVELAEFFLNPLK